MTVRALQAESHCAASISTIMVTRSGLVPQKHIEDTRTRLMARIGKSQKTLRFNANGTTEPWTKDQCVPLGLFTTEEKAKQRLTEVQLDLLT